MIALDVEPENDEIELDKSRPSFGEWSTEEDSAAEFDRRIESCGLFERVFKEVEGYYLAFRPNRQQRGARIDRILLPNKKLRDAGWSKVIGGPAIRPYGGSVALRPRLAASLPVRYLCTASAAVLASCASLILQCASQTLNALPGRLLHP